MKPHEFEALVRAKAQVIETTQEPIAESAPIPVLKPMNINQLDRQYNALLGESSLREFAGNDLDESVAETTMAGGTEAYTMEDEQLDGMALGELQAIAQAAKKIFASVKQGVPLEAWMYKKITNGNEGLTAVAQQINNPAVREQPGVAEGAPIVVMPSHKRLEKKHKPSLSRGMDPAKAQGEQDARDGKPYNNPYPFKKELGAPGNWEHNSYTASYDSVKKGVAEGSLEELANTSLDVKEPKDMYNVNDRKQTTYKLFKFKSGKNTFLINFTVKSPPIYGKKQNWNAVIVAFGVKEKQDDYSFGDEMNTDLTGKNKNQFLIYSTVINTIRRFITEYNTEIDEIIMQGAGERQEAMYQRFFQSAPKYFPGWHYDGKHSLVRDVPRQTGKKVKEQGVAEDSQDDPEDYRAHLLKTLPRMMNFLSKNVKGWKPTEEQYLAAIETGYQVMKHTGDVQQAGRAMSDELNTLHQMSQSKSGMMEAGSPAQQAARYNPNGTTYRGSYNKMPTLDPNDPVHHADRYGSEHDEPYEMDVDKEDLKRAIAKGMLDLSDNAKRVLELRFWDNLTLDEVAVELGVSRERIRQIEAKALRQLKHPSRSDLLRPFVQMAEAPKSAAVRLGNAIKRVQGTTAASQARSVIPSSIPKPEPKPQEKQVTKELKTGPAAHFTPKDAHVKRGQFVGGESKKKGADGKACWDGYRYNGTKNGKDSCVKVSEDIENIMSTLINKILVNEAIQNNNR